MTHFSFFNNPFHQRETLLQIARVLASNLDVARVLQLTLEHALRLLSGDAGLVALRRPDNQFDFFAGAGIPQAEWALFRPLLQELPQDLAQEGWGIPTLRGRLVQRVRSSGLGLGHVIAMPMVAQRVVVGVVLIFRRQEALPFTTYDEQVLVAFAEQAAVALRNALFVQQLRDERERLSTVLTYTADGVLLLDAAGRVEEINPAMSKMSGWDRESAIGQYGSRLVALVSTNNVPLPLPAVPPGMTEAPQVEGFLICADGQRGPYVGAIFAPLGDAHHKDGMVVTVRDLTARHEEETAKRAFIAGISHELKTPLTLILGYAETLARPDVVWSPEQMRESLEVIREEAMRLTGMVDEILDLARLEAGGVTLHPVQLDLGDVAAAIVETFAGAHPDRHFGLQRDGARFPVYADRERLMQAIRTLLANAIKYSPPGTPIGVEMWTNGPEVGVRVADEGPGVPEAERERIFERFVRGREHVGRSDGVGLGLAFARSIIEAHGGRIWVTGREKVPGALFHLALPRMEAGPLVVATLGGPDE